MLTIPTSSPAYCSYVSIAIRLKEENNDCQQKGIQESNHYIATDQWSATFHKLLYVKYSITSLVEIVNRFEIESTTIEKIVALGCKIEKIVTLDRKIENICITIWRFTVRFYCMIKCHDISRIFRTAPQDQPLPIKQTFALTVW